MVKKNPIGPDLGQGAKSTGEGKLFEHPKGPQQRGGKQVVCLVHAEVAGVKKRIPTPKQLPDEQSGGKAREKPKNFPWRGPTKREKESMFREPEKIPVRFVPSSFTWETGERVDRKRLTPNVLGGE